MHYPDDESAQKCDAGQGRRTWLQRTTLPVLAAMLWSRNVQAQMIMDTHTTFRDEAKSALARASMRTANTQVLFADLQPELVSSSLTMSPARLAASVGALAAAAKILGLPMTFSVAPQAGRPAHVIPELAAFANASNTFSRTSASPLLDVPTAAALARNRRTMLVIAGFSAEVVVVHAALDALKSGYDVQVPVDAIGSRSERTEAAVLRQIDRAGGVTTAIMTLMTSLEPELSMPPGSDVLLALTALRGG